MRFLGLVERIGREEKGGLDLKISALLIVMVLLAVEVVGDYLYIGIWYYALTLLVGAILGVVFYPRPFFLFGTLLSLVGTLLIYIRHNVVADRPDGMLVLGHMFSYPGYVLGVIVSAYFIRRYFVGYVASLMLAMLGGMVGFLLGQMWVCETLMSCSWLYGN